MRAVSFALATTFLVTVSPFDLSYAQSTDCAVTGISAEEAPPPLPEYDQPPIPAPGYIWTPGYWAGTTSIIIGCRVAGGAAGGGHLLDASLLGLLQRSLLFIGGYWGSASVSTGASTMAMVMAAVASRAARWDHGAFYYNRAVTNLRGATITNVYEKNVVISNRDWVSYNGGRGGLTLRPTAEEEAAAREPHRLLMQWQTQHVRAAQRGQHRFRLDQSRPSGPRGDGAAIGLEDKRGDEGCSGRAGGSCRNAGAYAT